ncbi:hypothetical protein SBF1_2160003 [Candidatus Desulfosporosinus infrequens]|uniref:Uncharacterized protein n=1 Tax=Candidatus Desulfosporosinus infrequens TaxID=2043169 RepID=A0A2U3KK59_9FIRM|nr:hypothetical protein SBF1_2160003 [Candidatus Desulfosporosinus infrequens]
MTVFSKLKSINNQEEYSIKKMKGKGMEFSFILFSMRLV